MSTELPTGKSLTILTPRPDMDVPQEFPEDLPRENLVLLLNDLHRWYEEEHLWLENQPFHPRLQNVIASFEKWTKGDGPLRIIATARSEPQAPEFWEHISPKNAFWSTFTIVELKSLHSDQVSALIDAAAMKFGNISVEDDAKEIIAKRNDGTFGSVILYLATEKTKNRTVIDEKMAGTEFTGVYRKDWEEKVYIPYVKPFPARVHVISALNLLDQAGVPFIKEVVTQLAARLWHSRLPLWWRRRCIQKALVALRYFVSESEDSANHMRILSCPESYFENRGDLVSEIPTITSALLTMTRNRQLRRSLFNPLIYFGWRLLSIDYGEHAEQVFARLAKLYPTSAAIRYGYGTALYRGGNLKQAQLELTQAIIRDPSHPGYHVFYADALGKQAMYTEAEIQYKTATRLTSEWGDMTVTAWIMNVCANYLCDMGREDEAISYLKQVLDMSSDDNSVFARCNLALILLDKGEQDEAIVQKDLAMQVSSSPIVHRPLARMHRRFGDPYQAIEHYSKVVEMELGHVYNYDAYLARAFCYIQMAEQQLAQQDLARARRGASTLIRRCPNNFNAIYDLAFIYMLQGHTRRAIRTLRRAQAMCALPGIISSYTKEVQLPSTMALNLTGYSVFLDALEHPEETRQRIVPGIRKLMEILNLIDPMDESLGSEPQQWDSQTDLRRIQDHVIRVQKDIQAGTQLLLIALPYREDSIEKITYWIQQEYLDFIILASDTLPFSEKDVVFSNSGGILMSKEEQIKEIEQTEDNTITKLVISIPYTSDSIESTFYIIVGNYLILVLRGSVASSFDESKVKFTRSTKEASPGEQQEEETATPEQLSLTEPELPASDSLPSMAAPIEPER